MMLTIEALMRAMTEDEVLEKFLSIAETLGLPARSWRKGGSLRVILRVVARVYAAFTAVVAAFIRSGFLETSTGDWLTLLAWYVYGVRRREATRATEKIRLTNTGGGLYEDNAPGAITVVNPTTEKAYRNVDEFTLGPLGTIEVMFEAVEVGSGSSAAPGAINQLETHLDGVLVTNLRSFVALDAESDPDLKQACRDKTAAASVRGPRGAYRWAVREARRDDGSPVNVNRVSVSTSSSKGIVTTTVAAPSGTPDTDDLDAIAESIEQRARPDGVTAITNAAAEVPIQRALTVYAYRVDGVTAEAIRALVEAAFLREGPRYPIGGAPKPPAKDGKVWADWIIGTAKAAHESIYEIDGEGDDVPLTPSQVAAFQITAPVVRLVEVSNPS